MAPFEEVPAMCGCEKSTKSSVHISIKSFGKRGGLHIFILANTYLGKLFGN
jgi:hypothetical protein